MIVMMKAQKAVLSLFQKKDLIDDSECLEYLESFTDEQFESMNVDIPMKHSQYSLVKHTGRTYLIYNTLFNSMITLSDSEYVEYENQSFKELDIVEKLVDNGFLIPASVDEFQRYDYYKKILLGKLTSSGHYTIALTTNCNARCIYCYEEGIPHSDMSMQTAERLAENLVNSNKEIEITWFGGEPLLKPEIITYISNFLKNNNKEFKSGIITNGSLLTEEIISYFFKIWNVEWVQITLDGTSDEYLKRKRYFNNKKDVFYTVAENIDCLVKHNIYVNVRLNIDKDNLEECLKVAGHLKNKYDKNAFLNVYPSFLYGNNISVFNEDEKISCLSAFYELYPPEMALLTSIPKVNACFYNQQGAFVIDTDGSILACDGDVGKQYTKFADIYQITSFDGLTKPEFIVPEIREMCKKCAYYPKCGGGCMSIYGNNCKYDACFMERYKTEYLIDKLINFK